MSVSQFIGNGIGVLYATNASSNITMAQVNTPDAVKNMRVSGATSAPLAAQRSAVATITIDACPDVGNITDVIIDSVNQIGGAVAVTPGNVYETAYYLALAINIFTPGTGQNFTAQVIDNVVYVYSIPSRGTETNGLAINVSVTIISIQTTTTTFSNGSSQNGIYDTAVGNKFYLNPSSTATLDDLTGATEITEYIVVRGLNSGIISIDKAVSNYVLTGMTRASAFTQIFLDTDGAPTNVLAYINPYGYIVGDSIRICQYDVARIVTLEDATISTAPIATKNIYLTDTVPFACQSNKSIELRLQFDPIFGLIWVENGRSTTQIAAVGIQDVIDYNRDLINGNNYQGTGALAGNSGINASGFGTQAGGANTGNDVNFLGNQAGFQNTGNNVNAIGAATALNNIGNDVNAIGNTTAWYNEGSDVNAMGINAADQNLASKLIAIGSHAAQQSNGDYTNAIGFYAGANNVGSYTNAIGSQAGQSNQGNYLTAIGSQAGQNNEGSPVVAIGSSAAIGNTGNYLVAIGNSVATTNQQDYCIVIGHAGGANNIGSQLIAMGYATAGNNTGVYVTALGHFTCNNNTGNEVNSFGYYSAAENHGNNINSMGHEATKSNTGNSVNAFGHVALQDNTRDNVNALGYAAGLTNHGAGLNALGYYSAEQNTGDNLNAMGESAGQLNTGSNVNAFGYRAANESTGSDVNAFGYEAGKFNGITGATIFSNASLPSYLNYAAASAAITVGAGASAGCTYLYYDQTTFSVGAVRIP